MSSNGLGVSTDYDRYKYSFGTDSISGMCEVFDGAQMLTRSGFVAQRHDSNTALACVTLYVTDGRFLDDGAYLVPRQRLEEVHAAIMDEAQSIVLQDFGLEAENTTFLLVDDCCDLSKYESVAVELTKKNPRMMYDPHQREWRNPQKRKWVTYEEYFGKAAPNGVPFSVFYSMVG